MKFPVFALILSGFLVFLPGCGAPEIGSTHSENADGLVSIPFNRTLIDRQKRTLDARVIGFNGKEVTIVRLKDKTQFAIPLSKLSKQDQDFFGGVEKKSPLTPTSDRASSSLDSVKKSANARRLEEIEDEIKDLLKEMSRYDIDTMKWRSLNREIGKLRKEQAELWYE